MSELDDIGMTLTTLEDIERLEAEYVARRAFCGGVVNIHW